LTDIIELIASDHDRMRRLLSALDDAARYTDDAYVKWPLAVVWRRYAELTELHSAAEEEICYLPALGRGGGATARMRDALADHDDIREAIAETRLHPCGSAQWWLAVCAARRTTLEHLAREERDILPAFAARASMRIRDDLGRLWNRFTAARTRDASLHAGRRPPARAGDTPRTPAGVSLIFSRSRSPG
jgi:hypothetical protein